LNNEDKKSSKARKSVSSKDSKAKKILSKPIRKTKIPQTKLSKAEALKQDEIAPIKIKEVHNLASYFYSNKLVILSIMPYC